MLQGIEGLQLHGHLTTDAITTDVSFWKNYYFTH